MVMGRWGIWKEDVYHFSRAAVWGRMQAGQWGRSWTWRSAGNATVPPFQPGELHTEGKWRREAASYGLKYNPQLNTNTHAVCC